MSAYPRRVACSAAGDGRRDRRVAALDEPPRPADPGLAGVVDPDPRRTVDAGCRFAGRDRFETERRRRVAQVLPRPVGREPERRRDQPRTRREPLGSQGRDPPGRRRRRGRPSGRWRRVVARRMRSTRIGSIPSSGSNGAHEQRRRFAGGFGHHVEAVVHPVDKVHVGMAGRTEHDPVARRLPEARV